MEGAAPRYVGIAVSRETSAQAAVEEALRAVDLDDTCFLLALVPDGLSLDEVAAALDAGAGGVPVFGCTTAGTITTEGYETEALLILAFAGQNVSVASASAGTYYGNRRIARHAVNLFDQEGQLVLDNDALRVAARSILAEVLSCRENRTDSGIVARVAGDVVGAGAEQLRELGDVGADDEHRLARGHQQPAQALLGLEGVEGRGEVGDGGLVELVDRLAGEIEAQLGEAAIEASHGKRVTLVDHGEVLLL